MIWAKNLLASAGIDINGPRPFDIQIFNPDLYKNVLARGSLAFGEAYMNGWWDCKKLDEFFGRLLSADLSHKIGVSLPEMWYFAASRLLNLQSYARAFEVGKKHYDLGNDFFAAMVGPSMVYSCGYWRNAKTLNTSQYAKLDLICRKLGLKPGQKVLDIGSGFGAFARHAAKQYGAQVVGVTVSEKQLEFSTHYCQGLPVEFRLQDYHQVNEKFDHIVSIGMFEAVGPKNFRAFMQIARRCLKENGIFLLQTIGTLKPSNHVNPWINKYIFPNGYIPHLAQITSSIEGLFVIEDLHNFGADYDKTLMAWHKNFEAHWPTFKTEYGETFYIMWRYCLLSCAVAFRSRSLQLWQIVVSPHGVFGGYKAVR